MEEGVIGRQTEDFSWKSVYITPLTGLPYIGLPYTNQWRTLHQSIDYPIPVNGQTLNQSLVSEHSGVGAVNFLVIGAWHGSWVTGHRGT